MYNDAEKTMAEVIEFDMDGRKIVLSVSEYLSDKADERETYFAAHPIKEDIDLEAVLAKEAADAAALAAINDDVDA